MRHELSKKNIGTRSFHAVVPPSFEPIYLKKDDYIELKTAEEGFGMIYIAQVEHETAIKKLYPDHYLHVEFEGWYSVAIHSLDGKPFHLDDTYFDVDREGLWVPNVGESYFIPSHATGYCEMNYAYEDCEYLREFYAKGIVFKEKKHAEWVINKSMNPLILNAALAVDGLADFNDEERKLHYISIYNGNNGNNVCILEIMTWHLDTSKVWFKSAEKTKEALALIHCGKTIKEWLEG